MKIKNKLTNRVYRAHKVLVFTDYGLFKGYLPIDVIELILSFEDYDELR